MIKGTTTDGFNYEIDEAVYDDWELIEDLASLESGDISATVRVMKRLLGDQQFAALKEHARDPETGRVKTSVVLKVQHEIMTMEGPGKNS